MFETHEIEMLMEALDALEKEESSSLALSGLIGLVLARPGERDVVMEENKREMEEAKHKGVILRDRITLLKAKLIQLRDKALVEDIANSMDLYQS